ncbi:tetratricopeptide repeat-containing sulfotransferase family protein [Oricola cellulosilytica]|nr:tetratricopeptide repeat-containing sulfotransferase family protein [Oricola cellulosilytica]
MSSKTLSVDKAFRQAKTLMRKGEVEGARSLYQEILERYPQNARAQEALDALEQPQVRMRGGFTVEKAKDALALLDQGKFEEALIHARALMEAFPQVPFVHNLTGILLEKQGDSDGAVDSYRKAIEINPHFGEAYINLGEALNQRGQADLALPLLKEAVPLMDDPTMAWNNMGNSLLHLGRLSEAAEAYEKAVALRPRFAAAYRNLSMVKKFVPNDPIIATIGAMLQEKMPPEDHAHLAFALAKACEDIGENNHAFDLLAHGNRLMKQITGYTTEKDSKVFAKIKQFFAEPPPPLPVQEDGGPRPIFVLGMARSGTSLVEQILASHSHVFGGGELPALGKAVLPVMNAEQKDFDRAALEKIRSSYLGALKNLGQSSPVIVDKRPLNFRWIGYIMAALPEATVIHTRRNPMATGWSIYKQFFPAPGMSFCWDLADIAAYTELYEDLMAFWHEKYPGRIHDLQYEALTENQEDETRKLIAHCGLAWEDGCLEFHRTRRAVATASAAQVRKKMYTGSSEAWRKYEDRLGPLLSLAG